MPFDKSEQLTPVVARLAEEMQTSIEAAVLRHGTICTISADGPTRAHSAAGHGLANMWCAAKGPSSLWFAAELERRGMNPLDGFPSVGVSVVELLSHRHPLRDLTLVEAVLMRPEERHDQVAAAAAELKAAPLDDAIHFSEYLPLPLVRLLATRDGIQLEQSDLDSALEAELGPRQVMTGKPSECDICCYVDLGPDGIYRPLLHERCDTFASDRDWGFGGFATPTGLLQWLRLLQLHLDGRGVSTLFPTTELLRAVWDRTEATRWVDQFHSPLAFSLGVTRGIGALLGLDTALSPRTYGVVGWNGNSAAFFDPTTGHGMGVFLNNIGLPGGALAHTILELSKGLDHVSDN